MIQTMFLCAGLGTRLLPLTRELPKPMVPVGDKPILEHLLERAEAAGGRPCAVNAHHLQEKISEFIKSYRPNTHISREVRLLGTAGGVSAARAAFEPAPLVVWNSDILTRPNLAELVAGLNQAPLALAVERLAAGKGNVGSDGSGRIVRLRQQRIGDEESGGNYIGILAMQPSVVAGLPPSGCLIGDVAIPLMLGGARLVGVTHRQHWSDIGTLHAYVEENLRWLTCRGKDNFWIAPTANVSPRVELRSATVGNGASIHGEGLVERVVVWPGASCIAPLENAVVTMAGVVRLA